MAWPFWVPGEGDAVPFLGQGVGGGGTRGLEPRKVSVETVVAIGWIRGDEKRRKMRGRGLTDKKCQLPKRSLGFYGMCSV